MIFTPYTLMTMIISSVVVIVVLNVYFRKVNYEILFSPSALTIILLIPLLRMLIPVEFPFTKVIRSYTLLPIVSEGMTQERALLPFGYGISFLHVLVFVWVCGFLFFVYKDFRAYHRFLACFRHLEVIESGREQRVIFEYFSTRNRKPRPVRLLRMSGIQGPVIFGIRCPTIVLPDTEFTDQQLSGIISHELSHCIHGDLIIKRVVGILCAFYWWLPPVKECKRRIDYVMEIRADQIVMQGRSSGERKEYLETLLGVYRAQAGAVSIIENSASFSFGDEAAIKKRFNAIVTRPDKRHQKLLTISLFIILIAVFVLSFGFVIQPLIRHEEHVAGTFALPEDGSYFVLREDGYYDFYIDNIYMGVVNNREEHEEFKNFPIIDKKQEEIP